MTPESSNSRRFFAAISWLIGALVVLATWRLIARPLNDSDLWWHLANGRAMVEGRTFLRSDIFSHTLLGAPWINFEWLSQILFYGVIKIGGLSALFYMKAFFGLVAVGMVFLSLRLVSRSFPLVLFFTVIGVFLMRSRLLERPEIFTLMLCPAFMALLLWMERASVLLRQKMPWVFFGGMVLWVNLHGGFIYGMAIVVLYELGCRWVKKDKSYLKQIDHALFASFAGLLINPFGPKIFLVFVEHLKQTMAGPKGLIIEWGSTTVQGQEIFWLVYGAVIAGYLVSVLKRDHRFLLWVPVTVVFGLWGTVSTRNTALFASVALPCLVDLLNPWFQGMQKKPLGKYLSWGLLLGCVFPYLAHANIVKRTEKTPLITPGLVPKGACEFIEKNNIRGTLYNSYHYGGYIEWALGPERKVFMDPRYLFHRFLVEHWDLDRRTIEDYKTSDWPFYWNRYNIDYAITEMALYSLPVKDAGRDIGLTNLNIMFPRPQWALVYWDDAGCVFVRRKPEFQAVIDQHEYKYIWPYSPERMRVMLEAGAVAKEDFESDVRRQREAVGFSYVGAHMEHLIQWGIPKKS